MNMKASPLVLLALLSQFCSPQKKEDLLADKIQKVETGLINPVYLEGDSTWTIGERMKRYHVPGVSIAVINDGKIEWEKSYGVMDEETKEPVTNETLFQAGSISKPVAAYGALKIVEEGKIDLNENVNTYLKTWHLPDNEFTKTKKVALKHLLSHTGGLTVHGFLGYSPDLPVPTLVQVLDGTPPANSPPIRVDKVPEESFRYSGGGYTVMQQMLIDTEGKPFPEILKTKVLSPLGMTHSTYEQPLPPEELKKAATGYLPNGAMTKGKRHTYPEMAAAGLWTTAGDLARFAVNLQHTLQNNNGDVLSKAMTEKMVTPFVSEGNGLGLFIDKRKDDTYVGHGGWDEGFSSQMTVHRDKGYGVVVLTNSNHPEFIDELIRAVARAYDWSNYVPVYKTQPLNEATMDKVIGRYQNGPDDVLIIYKEGNRLLYKDLFIQPMELFAISDSTFIRRERTARIGIKTNPADGKEYLVFIRSDRDPLKFENLRLASDVRVPYEWLLEGKYERALTEYRKLKKSNPGDRAIAEETINSNGYELLNAGKVLQAKELFRINVELYPASANVYDSYAEACAKSGDKGLAITNYRKALALDPKNKQTEKKLADLLGEKKTK
jgi:CubicO group peptidase (beta-lactamase class C family)